ncbi:MAG: hypothetical protein JWO13_802 [Acidobacteriales bacterium]|nr:hypothetical protein [Terriglobales bacterium]
MKRQIMMIDGNPIAVLRPENAPLALRLASEMVGKGTAQEFKDLLQTQPYVFIGWAIPGTDRQAFAIADRAGELIDILEPGDSFVDGEMIDGAPVLRGSKVPVIGSKKK